MNFTIELHCEEDDERAVYIAGNFNQWKTQDASFQMQKIADKKYTFEFTNSEKLTKPLLYKFTKGDWSSVEIDQNGNRTENRTAEVSDGKKIDFVAKWRTNWLPFKADFVPQIKLISDEFEIPQLKSKRKIWALLPHDYEQSKAKYPVLYLHDAQNLFNEDSPFGNWKLDKKLAVMSEYGIGDIIIIAIEHAEKKRLKEYNVGKTKLGLGNGKQYIRFITDTLKPFVDEHFRTKTTREYTGIGGSSMGALVSIFAGMMYPEVYSKLLIFSPSLWVLNRFDIFSSPFFEPKKTKIYLYGGKEESTEMVEHINHFKDSILKDKEMAKKIDLNISINDQGKHNEEYWSNEFPKAIEWLYFRD